MPLRSAQHGRQRNNRKRIERGNVSSSKRGYGSRWRRLRRMVLTLQPMCMICKDHISVEVDHIIPKSEGGEDTLANPLANPLGNLRGLCSRCHGKKSAGEAWGNTPC